MKTSKERRTKGSNKVFMGIHGNNCKKIQPIDVNRSVKLNETKYLC